MTDFARQHPHIWSSECPLCHDVFTPFGLKLHLTRRHKARVVGYRCPDCGKLLPTERGRKIHRGRMHGGSRG
jgi:hypothetical protein